MRLSLKQSPTLSNTSCLFRILTGFSNACLHQNRTHWQADVASVVVLSFSYIMFEWFYALSSKGTEVQIDRLQKNKFYNIYNLIIMQNTLALINN